MSTAGIVIAAIFAVILLIAGAAGIGIWLGGRRSRAQDVETARRVEAEVDADAARIKAEEAARSDDDVLTELQANTRRAR